MSSFAKTVKPGGYGKIKKIVIKLKIKDCTGTVKATDFMFQGGSTATRWIGHPSELRWSFDNE